LSNFRTQNNLYQDLLRGTFADSAIWQKNNKSLQKMLPATKKSGRSFFGAEKNHRRHYGIVSIAGSLRKTGTR
jgi:hypothetical protein